MNSIAIKSKDKILTVSWKNNTAFKQFIGYQRNILLRETSSNRLGFTPTKDIIVDTQIFFNNLWDNVLAHGYYDGLPNNPTVLDIGSGIGLIDILAYQYLNNSGKFYLLDKDGLRTVGYDVSLEYTPNHGFYHSWAVTDDVLISTNCNQESFSKITPIEEWPDNIDMITSWGSYCWHYPFDTYWNKIKKHLNVGGKLVLEISVSAEADSQIIKIISNEFNSTPSIHQMGTVGYRCVWIRKQ